MRPIVVITGGSRGIGRATALLAAERGFSVAVGYLAAERAAAEVCERARALGVDAIKVQADVSSEASVLRLFETVDKELGSLSALVNNAGILMPQMRFQERARQASHPPRTHRQRRGGS
jgi:NAD(P)-dependent dehydrogenase (short-subunit alcohol dehydrogenase family)